MDSDPNTHRPSDEQVVQTLLEQLAGGKIHPHLAMPVIVRLAEKIGGDGVPCVAALVDFLEEDSDNPATQALVEHLREVQILKALEVHRGTASGEESEFYIGDLANSRTPAWPDPFHVKSQIKPLFQLLEDWIFIRKYRDRCICG